jgi:hypothetical protein
MFDAATLREEMVAIEQKLSNGKSDPKLVDQWVMYSRKLREIERNENGYVTARNSVTGY